MDTKSRYKGIQTVFKNANSYACLFLSLLSIAEEENNKEIDFIEAYRLAIKNKCMNDQFYMLDQEKFLKILTGKKFIREMRERLPTPVPNNMYTVEKWYNPRTGYTHFKRRGFDTLVNSTTTKEGKRVGYYCYILEGE